MSINLRVLIHASVTVNPNDWPTFQDMVTDVKVIVAKEGKDKVIMHETYYQSESNNCLIIEEYKDEAAFLNHLELIRPLSDKYKIDWKITQLYLSGGFSTITVNAMKDANRQALVSFYNKKL